MQQPQDIASLLYRVNAMEKDIAQIQTHLTSYETTRENELKLQPILATLQRLGVDLAKVSDRLDGMSTLIATQNTESIARDTAISKSLDRLQIRVLIGVVSSIFMLITGVLVAFITHFI